jgi:radical SAM superfamily enzyme YgiQ (UPF0313 family)
MKILFIYYTDFYKSWKHPIENFGNIQLGISYLSSTLKEDGNETKLFILNNNTKLRKIISYIRNYSPQVIAFYYATESQNKIPLVAQEIKKRLNNVFLIAGGVFPTLFPEIVLNQGFDAVCRGDGELPLKELVKQLSKGKVTQIPNIWIKKGKTVERNPITYFTNYDQVAYPDWKLWDRYIWDKKSLGTILVGKGCPFNCTYCLNPKLKKLTRRNEIQLRSPKIIINELKTLLTAYPYLKKISLQVETIGSDFNYLKDLCDKLKRFNDSIGNKIVYSARYRIRNTNNETKILPYLKKANITCLEIGVETGSERIRKDVLKRYGTNKSLIAFTKEAKRLGFTINTYIMIGLPTETLEDFQKTIKILRVLEPDRILQAIYTPYPGTELYEKYPLQKYSKGNKRERFTPFIYSSTFTKKQILKEFIFLSFKVQKNYKPMSYIVKDAASKIIYSNNFLHSLMYPLWLFFNSLLYYFKKVLND